MLDKEEAEMKEEEEKKSRPVVRLVAVKWEV